MKEKMQICSLGSRLFSDPVCIACVASGLNCAAVSAGAPEMKRLCSTHELNEASHDRNCPRGRADHIEELCEIREGCSL